MWATTVYDLGLSSSDFYELTPRQYALLVKAHRRGLAHREMVQAYTTAAVINYSICHPDEAVQPATFAPNFKLPDQPSIPKRKYTEDEVIDWQARVAQLAHEMKQGHGAMLDEITGKANG